MAKKNLPQEEMPEDADVAVPAPRKRKKRAVCQAPNCDPLLGEVPPLFGNSIPATFQNRPPTFSGSPWGRMK